MSKKEKDLAKVTGLGDNEFIRAVAADGSSILIKKSDLLPVVTTSVSGIVSAAIFQNIMTFRGRCQNNTDYNDLKETGYYNNVTGNGENNSNWPYTYGILLVFHTDGNYGTVQIHIRNTGIIHTRIHWGSQWGAWKELIFKE